MAQSGFFGDDMPVIRIPLVGQVTHRDISQAKSATSLDQYFKECHFDVFSNSITGARKITVRPRQGFSNTGTPGLGGASTLNAVKVWTGNSGTDNPLLSAWASGANNVIYENTTSRGTASGDINWISETSISGTANFVAHGSSGAGADVAYFYPEGGAFTKITDAQYPGNASLVPTGQMIHMDGYAFIMTTNGDIWNSDLNSLSAWTATSFVNAQFRPDGGVGLARYRKYIVAFGKQSMELLYNAGNTSGSPLSPVQGGGRNIGCVSQNHYCEALDTVFWAGGGSGGSGAFMLDGLTPRKISTPAIDLLIASSGYTGFVSPVVSFGRVLIVFGFGDSNPSHVFDPSIGMWSQTYNSATNDGESFRHTDIYSDNSGSLGFVCIAGPRGSQTSLWRSGNAVVTATVNLPEMDFGTFARKIVRRASIIGKCQDSTPITLTTSSPEGTFSNTRTFTLNSGANVSTLYRLNGTFRSGVFNLSWANTDADAATLEALELDIEVLQS